MDNFWKEISWQFKAIWAAAIGLGIVLVGFIIWAIIRLINHFT